MEWKLLENGRYKHEFRYILPGCKYAGVNLSLTVAPPIPTGETLTNYLKHITSIMDQDPKIQAMSKDVNTQFIENYYILKEKYLP